MRKVCSLIAASIFFIACGPYVERPEVYAQGGKCGVRCDVMGGVSNSGTDETHP